MSTEAAAAVATLNSNASEAMASLAILKSESCAESGPNVYRSSAACWFGREIEPHIYECDHLRQAVEVLLRVLHDEAT